MMQDITGKILSLPRQLKNVGDVSIRELLKGTGYFQLYEKVTEDSIKKALSSYPESIAEWISYSEDKRSTSGYYLKEEGVNSYIVGYLDEKKGMVNEIKYAERIDACASFIKREIEDIRLIN
jgi:hypothetical protein